MRIEKTNGAPIPRTSDVENITILDLDREITVKTIRTKDMNIAQLTSSGLLNGKVQKADAAIHHLTQ